jgi:hypothetical protein
VVRTSPSAVRLGEARDARQRDRGRGRPQCALEKPVMRGRGTADVDVRATIDRNKIHAIS